MFSNEVLIEKSDKGCLVEILKEIGKLQTDYNYLKLNDNFTKKTMCDLVIPFRDKYHLSDRDALAIARNEISVSEIAKIIENGLRGT